MPKPIGSASASGGFKEALKPLEHSVERVPPTLRVSGLGAGRESSSGLFKLLTPGGIFPKEKAVQVSCVVIPRNSHLAILAPSHTTHLRRVYQQLP